MQTKKNSKGKDSFWKRLTKPQLRLLRGGDGDSSSNDSSSASTRSLSGIGSLEARINNLRAIPGL